MTEVWQVFQEGGWWSWLSLLLALIAFALSVIALCVALFRTRAGVLISWLSLSVSLLPTGVGAVGMQFSRAKVDQVGISNCVPTGCYHDVVVIAEFNNDEPGKTQLKYYAPGVGGIRTGWRGKNEKEREELGLTTQATLSDAELASVDKAMLTEEKRAYSRRPQVFGQTAHMEKA